MMSEQPTFPASIDALIAWLESRHAYWTSRAIHYNDLIHRSYSDNLNGLPLETVLDNIEAFSELLELCETCTVALSVEIDSLQSLKKRGES